MRNHYLYHLDNSFIFSFPESETRDLSDLPEKLTWKLKNATVLFFPESERFSISPGYLWDGCTPKIAIFDIGVLGIPDGILSKVNHKPKLYYASLIHDVLYQMLNSESKEGYRLPYSRLEIDRLFYNKMREAKFSLSRFYYRIVRLFGGLFMRLP